LDRLAHPYVTPISLGGFSGGQIGKHSDGTFTDFMLIFA
jgi:hypothetical protein